MPVVTESDIAAGFHRFFAESPLKVSVPGGLWFGVTPQESAFPYGRLDVSPTDPEHNSSTTYLQRYTVNLAFWDNAGATEQGKLKAAIAQTFARNRVLSKLTVPNADRLVDVRPVAPSGDGMVEEAAQQEQVPIIVSRLAFEVTVQASTL